MSHRRVLVTGASGLLGTWLRRTAPAGHEVVGLVHRTEVPGIPTVHADLRVRELVDAAFASARPSLVLHAAYAHDEASIVGATEHVCAAAEARGADVALVSTDAVFSGDGRPLHEDDAPDPVADYGRWKAAAEQRVLAGGGAVIRLPLLVSADPADHMLVRLRDSADSGVPAVWFTDELRRPAHAVEVAAAIWRIVALPVEVRSGCWHLAGQERMSRYELARRIAQDDGGDITVVGDRTPPDAVRPRDLDLVDERARRQIGWKPTPIG